MTNEDLYIILRPHAGQNVAIITRIDGSVALLNVDRNLVIMSADQPKPKP